MQRPAVIDFTGIIHQHLDWYNASFSVDPGVYNKSRKSLQQDRAGKLSLHQFQTFYQDAACSVSFQNLDTPGTTKISPSDHIHLRFSIRGGTELPHFYMELQLRHPTDCNKSIQLSMIWTAWDLKAFGSDRKVTWKPTGNERFTFSSRLSGVSFRSSTHTSESAKDVGGTEGRPYYKIEWTHVTTPHCYGFGVPYTVSWLNQEQQRALRSFRAMNKTETTIRVSTRTESQMYPNWALMTAMPTPTPPPFPLYDCRYEVHQGEFGVIRNIPSTSNTTIQEHHRRRKIGWPNNLPGFQDPPQIFCFETSAPLTYVNERHYEATKTIGLLREADIQQANYIKQFNRQYDFDLWPASVVHNFQHHTMDEYFYAALRVDLRVADDVQTMALPEPGTAVSVTTSKHAGFTLAKGAESQSASRNRWSGVVVGSVEFPQQADLPPTMVRVRLRRPQRLQSVGSVLHLAGWVTFGNPNVAINQLKRAIRYAMYGNKDFGIMPNNPIKKLLLGHENSSLRFYTTSNNVISCAEAYIGSNTTMHNPRQIEALRSIFTFGDWMKLVTLVTGPPGTGKTDISASVAECSYLNNMPILIVCGSNYGLNVVAERILERFKRANPKLNTDGLYRLDTDFGETIEMQMAPVAPDRNNKDFRSVREYLLASGVTPLLENAVRQSLSALIDVGPGRSLGLSLGRHIIQRIDLALELRSNWPQSNNQEREEYLLIWDFVTWQQCLLREGRAFAEPVDLEEADGPGAAAGGLFDAQDMHDIFVINHKRAWLCLQEYYISRAKIVLCTASTASRKCLRQFKPTIIIVEEASQLTETSALNAIVRYLPSLKKVVLSGDTAQLPPTVLSMDKNECFYSEKMSLFERLKLTGLPHIELNIQYRMNPQIATFVSNEFYNGRLQSHRSCNGRDTANDFSDAMVERYNCSNGTIFFVSVNNSSVWRRKGSWSLVNLEYVNFIGQLVLYFLGKGCPERSILILSFYDEERGRLSELIHKRLNRKNVRISNVDASQGDAEDIVILSTTRPGRRYGLGFVQNRQRQCVALSRAKDGLVVVGHEQMHTSSTPGGKGFLTWKQLTDYCRNSGRLITVNGSTNLVRTHLDLPNADYEDIAH